MRTASRENETFDGFLACQKVCQECLNKNFPGQIVAGRECGVRGEKDADCGIRGKGGTLSG